MLMEMLVVSTVFTLSLAWRTQRLAGQSGVMVYSLRNHTAVAVVQGFNSVLLCDEELLAEPSAIDYSLKGHWAIAQLPMNPPCFTLAEDFNCPIAVKRKYLLSAQGVLLAFWNPDSSYDHGHKVDVDYVLVCGRQKPNLRKVLAAYHVGTLLIDGSVPGYQAQEWMQQAEASHIPCRSLRDGVVCLNLNH